MNLLRTKIELTYYQPYLTYLILYDIPYNDMITKGQLKFRIGYSLSLSLMLLLAAGFDYLIKNTTATSECRPPVEMTNNPRFLVEKCDDGSSYVTDTEDGNKTFVASGETKRVCTYDGICFELSSA
jgi:hypothetical protein